MKIFRRAVSILFIFSILLLASISHAEIYTGEGKYIMSEGENLGVAKERAKADAMRNACEKAGTYVKSYSRSKNFELEEDIIKTMTANIIKLIEEKFLPYEQLDNLEGLLIHVIVKAQIDDSDIIRWLKKTDDEKSILVAQMEALRKANEEQARQIEELKRQLKNNPQDAERITQEFADADKIFLSNQKLDEAKRLTDNGKRQEAIKIYDEAIELNPNSYWAYYSRGETYGALGQYDKAVQDYGKAIQINPVGYWAYGNRGWIYLNRLGKSDLALADYNKAIELNPNSNQDLCWAYVNRGAVYGALEKYNEAIQDYNKAIELNPNYASTYYNRGWLYQNRLGKIDLAIQDYSKFISLNPNYLWAYQNRGLCYQALGDAVKAQADFEKAKQLGYNG